MCDEPVPCQCTLERRAKRRSEHMARRDVLNRVAYQLYSAGQTDDATALYTEADQVWDDAIHIASSDDPLRSLCGYFGRNLTDLPKRPGGGEGCWSCLHHADDLARAAEQELVTA